MKKRLSDMTNAELWELFPIILREHDPRYAKLYWSESDNVAAAVGDENIVRISHIGSTAVPGLIAKPTIDILLEIAAECNTEKLKHALVDVGYIFTAQPDNPPPHMMFLKGYTPEGFKGQAYHVHVRYLGDWGEHYFRDYLQANRDAANEYGRLKAELMKRFEHDRDAYTEAKTEFIKRYTALARAEYRGRYEIT